MNNTDMLKFIKAGNAFFTISNEKTNFHATYNCNVSAANEKYEKVHWVGALTGPDNYYNYQYFGRIMPDGKFMVHKKFWDNDFYNKLTPEQYEKKSIFFKKILAFLWVYNRLVSGGELPEWVKIQHAGKCAACGRMLSTPQSLERGYGDCCARRLGIV